MICKNCSDHLELFLEFTWLKTKILEPLRYVTTINEIDIVVSWAAIAARSFEGEGGGSTAFFVFTMWKPIDYGFYTLIACLLCG